MLSVVRGHLFETYGAWGRKRNQRHHMMDGDEATPKEKAFRNQRYSRNSSQTENAVSQLRKLGKIIQEEEVLAWLLSVGDSSGTASKRRCSGSKMLT